MGVKNELKPLHKYPHVSYLDYFLLPVGYVTNRDFVEAKKGDKIIFHDGIERTFIYSMRIPVNGLCNMLCMMRYGYPIQKVIERWQRNAILLGSGIDSINTDECLIVFFNRYDKDSDNDE